MHCSYPNGLHEADLVELTRLQKNKDNSKFILTVINYSTRYAWATPLKNKGADTVAEVFRDIYFGGRVPTYLEADTGKKFKAAVAAFLRRKTLDSLTLQAVRRLVNGEELFEKYTSIV